jgi:hypothetical protein
MNEYDSLNNMADNKIQKRVYIRTFGWPLVTVARDGAGDIKEDKCFGVN